MISVADAIAINGLFENHKMADQDSADETTTYFGFTAGDGSWYILRQEADGNEMHYRYARGQSGYTAAWTARALQTYEYFHEIFPTGPANG